MRLLYSQRPVGNFFQFTLAALVGLSLLLAGCVTGKAVEPQPYLREQGDFFMQAGIKSYTQYNFRLASEQFTQAKNFYTRFNDALGTVHAMLNLAQVQLTSGNYDLAGEYLNKADLLIKKNKLTQAAVYHDLLLTGLYLNTDNLAAAEQVFNKHHQLLPDKITDDTSLALLINRVRLAQLSNTEFTRWLEILVSQTALHSNADSLLHLQRFNAWQAFLTRDTQRGNQLYSAAMHSYRKQANPTGLMSTQLEWAQACSNAGDWPHATEHFEQALSIAMANHHAHNALIAVSGLRNVYLKTQGLDKLPQLDEWEKQLKSLPADALAP